jgi:hypothetical protein
MQPQGKSKKPMPKRTDIHKILIIGAGPIVIGQACEFDYSGTQACKALKAEGYEVVLVNSNPATIMTDPEMGIHGDLPFPRHISIKESVFPFGKLPGVDLLLGPEMKSTGEVMGIATDFGAAYAKAQLGAGQRLPTAGAIFISVEDKDKPSAVAIAAGFRSLGFDILSTDGTARFLAQHGVQCQTIKKVSMGRPHVVDAIKNKRVHLVVNTAGASGPLKDGYAIRRAALAFNVPYTTTIHGAEASLRAIASMKREAMGVVPIQDYYSMKNSRENFPSVRDDVPAKAPHTPSRCQRTHLVGIETGRRIGRSALTRPKTDSAALAK